MATAEGWGALEVVWMRRVLHQAGKGWRGLWYNISIHAAAALASTRAFHRHLSHPDPGPDHGAGRRFAGKGMMYDAKAGWLAGWLASCGGPLTRTVAG